ncbi:MAG TPA: choice-of-anchor D domain-containing protein [Candidatus Saccharimonadales bacterium]|nr:choice-of-anchor D domain-containing protein [Candidatus Saccharimonadales bacterium]
MSVRWPVARPAPIPALLAAVLALAAGCSRGPVQPNVASQCGLQPDHLDFDSVRVGQTAERTADVYNLGPGNLSASALLSDSAFSVVGGSTLLLAPGDRGTLRVRFAPARAGARACTLTVRPGGCRLALQGTGWVPTGPVPPPPASPWCSVSSRSLDFGRVEQGDSAFLAFTVRNLGGGVLRGRPTLVAPAGFTLLGPDSFALGAQESVSVRVRFSPPAPGAFGGGVHLADNGACPDPVSLFGRGRPLPIPGYAEWSGAGAGRLQGPLWLAVGPSGDVYATDTLAARVLRFTPDGQLVRVIGGPGEGLGQFRYPPAGIAVDGREHLYVLDTGNGRLDEFTGEGALAGAWNYLGQVSPPLALATDGDTLLYVLTTLTLEIRGPTAGTLRSLAAPSPLPNSQCGLAAAGGGRVVVTDADHHGLWVYEPGAGGWAAWGSGCQFVNPLSAAADSSGTLFVGDDASRARSSCLAANRVLRVGAGGAILGAWGLGDYGAEDSLVVEGLAAGRDGRVYVADPARGVVHCVPAAALQPAPATPWAWP